jgi:hypothetical protein
MSSKLYGAAIAAAFLGSASMAHAGYQTVDLAPYVNHGFANSGWFIDGGNFEANLPGTTHGNQGSPLPFNVADVPDNVNGGNLNFWYGLDDGSRTNLFNGPAGSITVAVNQPNAQHVYVLADNVFGNYFADEFDVTFHGAGGDLSFAYVGGVDTRDYNTPNCATTGCTPYMGTPWYDDGGGIVLDARTFNLPKAFGLTSITFTQNHPVDGMILAGVTVGVPEPAAWTLMIGGFGLAGAMLRRRRLATA